MAILGIGKNKKAACPKCKKQIKSSIGYCPHCGHQSNAICPDCLKPIKAVKGYCPHCGYQLNENWAGSLRHPGKGLNVWDRGTGEIACRVEIKDLKSNFKGKKRLLIAPGTRAIPFEDGKMLPVWPPGNYALSDRGIEDGVLAKIAKFFDSPSYFEIYLVNDSELKITMGGKDLVEEKKKEDRRKMVKIVEELFYSTPELARMAAENQDIKDFFDSHNDGFSNVEKKFRKHGYDQMLEYLDWASEKVTELNPGKDSKDLKTLQAYLGSRKAKLLRIGERFITEAMQELGLLKVKTLEGFEIGLSVDLFFRIEGNMDFINNVVRGRPVLTERDLINQIHGTLQNVLQSVVKEIQVQDLYGNMEIRDQIRSAIKTNLAPTLKDWGLKFCRVEGFDWTFGRYEEILKEDADRKIEKETATIEKKRRADDLDLFQDKIDGEIARKRKEAEKEVFKQMARKDALERESDIEYSRALGEVKIRNLNHQTEVAQKAASRKLEIELESAERAAQLETYRAAMEIKERLLQVQHQQEVEKIQTENDIQIKKMKLIQGLSPEHILALAAERNPKLVPALEAYAKSAADKTQVKLIQDFSTELLKRGGENQKDLKDIIEYALNFAGGVAAAKIKDSQSNKASTDETGAGPKVVLCAKCAKEIPPPPPKDKLCPNCKR
jgi:hypothetical protein